MRNVQSEGENAACQPLLQSGGKPEDEQPQPQIESVSKSRLDTIARIALFLAGPTLLVTVATVATHPEFPTARNTSLILLQSSSSGFSAFAAVGKPALCLVWPSLAVFVVLASTNVFLRRYAGRNPTSWLTTKNTEGILCMEAWNYIVSVAVQLSLIPVWIILCFFKRPEEWWYGWRVDSVSTVFASILIGYYLQDSVTNFWENSAAILAHHIGTVVLIALCFMTLCWHGMLLTVGFSYELGSVAMGLVDLGLLCKWKGPFSMALSTVVGMAMVLIACCHQLPCDVPAWIAIVMFLLGGVARLQQAHAYQYPKA